MKETNNKATCKARITGGACATLSSTADAARRMPSSRGTVSHKMKVTRERGSSLSPPARACARCARHAPRHSTTRVCAHIHTQIEVHTARSHRRWRDTRSEFSRNARARAFQAARRPTRPAPSTRSPPLRRASQSRGKELRARPGNGQAASHKGLIPAPAEGGRETGRGPRPWRRAMRRPPVRPC